MTPGNALSILSFGCKLREGRGNWLSTWEELATFFLPNRTGFLGEETEGDEGMEDIYTSAPMLARRGLATALSTMLRPPGQMWFRAKAKRSILNYDENVRAWLDEVTQITYDYLYDADTKAENQLAECDNDLVTFGFGALMVRWDKAARKLKIKCPHPKNCVFAKSESGDYDMSFVFSKMTIRQIVQTFGEDKLTNSMRDALNGEKPDLEKKFEIMHAVLPNADYKKFGRGKNRLPFASLWFSVSCKELLDQGGYNSFPYVVPQWDATSMEDYPRGPSHVALNDARLANAITKTLIQAAEKALDPPLVAPADMIRGDVELFAGGLTLYDAGGFQYQGDPVKAINLGKSPEKMLEFLATVENRIYAAFYRDILELPSSNDRELTATEISARLDQYLRQAGPIFARVENNYNAALINRVFDLLATNGVYPPAPEVLEGEELVFDYESPVKQARDRARAMKVMEGVTLAGNMAQFKPDVLDNLDGDTAFRMMWVDMALPQAIMTPIQQMMEGREARAKEMQQMKMAQMAQMAGPGAAQMLQAAAKAKDSGMMGPGEQFPWAAPQLPSPGSDEDAAAGADVIDAVAEDVTA